MPVNWTREWAGRVAHRLEQLVREPDGHSRWDVEATMRTNSLPVYSDLSGSIVLSLTGDLLFYDDESEAIRSLDNKMWRRVALVSLVEKYPEFRRLPPAEASDCGNCSGTGRVLNGHVF